MPQVKVEQVETVEGCSHEVRKSFFYTKYKPGFSSKFTGLIDRKRQTPVSHLQVALPTSDQYKPLKPRVGKAAKVRAHSKSCLACREFMQYSSCLVGVPDPVSFLDCFDVSCRNTLLFWTLSSVRPSCVLTTTSLCLCRHTPLLARLSVPSEWTSVTPPWIFVYICSQTIHLSHGLWSMVMSE